MLNQFKDPIYFQQYVDYFWQTEEGGQILSIPNATSIAYKQLIVNCIEKIAFQGLPPFGSLLLVIIATNTNGKEDIQLIRSKFGSYDLYEKAMNFLILLSTLPEKYRTGSERILLLQVLFEGCHGCMSLKNSRLIVEQTKKHKFILDFKEPFSSTIFNNELKTIALISNKFDSVESILNALQSTPVLEEIVLETSENKQPDFVDQLVDNYKTFHVGALVKRIIGGINIPVHNARPNVQPLGGISDLTNKGDFDKLLISEFANDDIIFLSRLANNEALYLQREIPPSKNELERIFLIDISLRNWGTPKTLAFATMLAIAKHPKTDIPCSVFCVGEKTITQIDIETVDGIIDGLTIVESCAHAAEGFNTFFKDQTTFKNKEIIIVTDKNTLRQSPMVAMVNNYFQHTSYWIHPDDEGNIDLFKNCQNSKKHLQHIYVPLQELWSKKKKNELLANSLLDPILIYPILFKLQNNTVAFMKTADNAVFCLTKTGLLFRKYDDLAKDNQKGWEFLMQDIKHANRHAEIGLSQEGYVLFTINIKTKEFTLTNLSSKHQTKAFLPDFLDFNLPAIFYENNLFLHSNKNNSSQIDLLGTVSARTHRLAEFHLLIDKRVSLAANYKNSHKSNFRNIKNVAISPDSKIIFNQHHLKLLGGANAFLRVEQVYPIEERYFATRNGDEFIFDDGSRVFRDHLGLINFISSDLSLPTFYLASLINTALAAFSEKEYCGHENFMKCQRNRVIITTIPENWDLNAFKNTILEKYFQAEQMSVELPFTITKTSSASYARELLLNLQNFGFNPTIETEKIANTAQEVSVDNFYSRYFTPFINTILQHGT
jgi:MoxR-vWA-beta-propeller ternary system domain bpX0/MoxR-vWA-beta-propeller ternary system domain bpX1